MTVVAMFPGGVHPETHKTESNSTPIQPVPLLARYSVPLLQHIGEPAHPIVHVGQRVLRGQVLGHAHASVSAAVHAPTSGTVIAIAPGPVAHPSRLPDLCVDIEADGLDEPIAFTPIDWQHLPPKAVRDQLRELGVVGQGGAVFPSHLKLAPARSGALPLLIINGAECEPWITCDDRLMRERAAEVFSGARIMAELLGAQEIRFGIEDNKPEAVAALRAQGATVDVVPTLYPMGSGRQLAYVMTGRTPPSGGRMTDIGIQMFNSGTSYSVYRAITLGEPVITRIVTVTGAVHRPGNYEVRIGTPIRDLLNAAGGAQPTASGYLIGGPMMGFDLHDLHAPVSKGINCIIVKEAAHFPPPPRALPCIRCGQCALACPVSLHPFEMYSYAKARDFTKVASYNLADCIECGCCSFVCPSHLPLVDFFRFAKSEIDTRAHEKRASELARVRHEFRAQRIEREKQEKAARHAQAAKKSMASSDSAPVDPDADRKKAILAAAMARAEATRAQQPARNTENLSPSINAEIAAIEAQRAAHQDSKP